MTIKKTDKTNANLNCALLFVNSNAKTPRKILTEEAPYGGIPFLLPIEAAHEVIDLSWKSSSISFFEEHKEHLQIAERNLIEVSQYTQKDNMDLLMGKFIMAPYLIDVMKANKMQMLCIDEETAWYAWLLAIARNQALLAKQFLDYLPNGESLLFTANHMCLLLYARTPGTLTGQFWDDLPSENEQLFMLKNPATRKKALYDMKLYIGMNRDSSANVVLFAPDKETAKKLVRGYIENKEVEGLPPHLGFGVHEVNGGVIKKIRTVERIYI